MEYTQEQMEALHKAMHNMYEDNMKFLEIYNKRLYDEVINFSTEINNGEYNIRYELEFVKNSFNIFDNQSKQYLYENSLDQYTQDVLNQLDYSTKGSISNLAEGIYSTDKVEDLRLLDNDIQTKSFKRIIKDINNVKDLLDETEVSREVQMKYVPTFTLFGSLLASHFYPIKQKFNPKSFLIVEPNIEIFRLSLFVTEYKILTQDCRLFFSVGQSNAQMIKRMESFILFDSLENYAYKYYSTSYHDKQLFNNFTLALQNLSPFAYDHYRQIYYAKESIKNINKYPVLIENKYKSKIQDLPVLVLSPGPSLRKNFKWLKKNKDKFITIAFGASVKALSEAKIVPDIITSVDASTLITKQFPKECNKTYKNSLALLASDSLKDIFQLFKKKNTFVFEANFKIVKDGLTESPALTVGDNTMHILLSMGFKQIYLLGTDLAIDIDVGVSYDKTHRSSKSKHNMHYLKKNIKKISEDIDVSENYIEIDSNFGQKKLYGNQLFLKLLESYHSIIGSHRRRYEFEVYNLTDGAKIQCTKSIQPSEVKLPDIKAEKSQHLLKQFFLGKAQVTSSKDEQKEIDKEIEFLNELILFVKEIKDKDIVDYDEFYSLRKEYAIKIVNHKSYSSLTLSMLSNYVKVIDSFINFIFNDKFLRYSVERVNVLKNEWSTQVVNLIQEYKKVLEEFKI